MSSNVAVDTVVKMAETKKSKLPFKSTVWVAEATGLLLKADYAVEGIPVTQSLTYSMLLGLRAAPG